MNHYLTLIITLFLVGISFLIMSLGCIKNKYIVYSGAILFILAVAIFLIGFKDVIFT